MFKRLDPRDINITPFKAYKEFTVTNTDSGSGNKKYKFIDDSGATSNPTVNQGGRVFNIVSGSISGGTTSTHTAAASQGNGAYGLFYPDLGILVFNGPALNASASLSTNTTSNAAGGNVVELSLIHI